MGNNALCANSLMTLYVLSMLVTVVTLHIDLNRSFPKVHCDDRNGSSHDDNDDI